MNQPRSNSKQPNRKQYKLTTMQIKVLRTLATFPHSIKELYDICSMGTYNSDLHCNIAIGKLRKIGYISNIPKNTTQPSPNGLQCIYYITLKGHNALNQILEVPAP